MFGEPDSQQHVKKKKTTTERGHVSCRCDSNRITRTMMRIYGPGCELTFGERHPHPLCSRCPGAVHGHERHRRDPQREREVRAIRLVESASTHAQMIGKPVGVGLFGTRFVRREMLEQSNARVWAHHPRATYLE